MIEIKEKTNIFSPWRFCVAPMMDWTDRHCRYFHRLLSAHARLYAEMLTSAAIIHGDRDRLLGFDAFEQPVAAQLGGAAPQDLARAAAIAAEYGYCEINLNVGCPSDRVQDGRFGACLMLQPDLVAECVAAMKLAVKIPVTVKCRIGVDDQAPRDALFAIAEKTRAAGVDALIVHARKAWLQGLSPRENRDIPPLDYQVVHELKRATPDMPIAINGGLVSMTDCARELADVDGVMLGRAAYHHPELLLSVDRALFGQVGPCVDAHDALRAYLPYIEARLREGVRLAAMTRHLLGLFAGRRGARGFRRLLTEQAVKPGAGVAVVERAMALVEPVAAAELIAS